MPVDLSKSQPVLDYDTISAIIKQIRYPLKNLDKLVRNGKRPLFPAASYYFLCTRWQIDGDLQSLRNLRALDQLSKTEVELCATDAAIANRAIALRSGNDKSAVYNALSAATALVLHRPLAVMRPSHYRGVKGLDLQEWWN